MNCTAKYLNSFILSAIVLFAFALSVSSCEEEADLPTSGTVSIQMDYSIDGQDLIFDQINYTNKAGNNFSVTHLEYFISNLVLVAENGREFAFDEVFYLNPRKAYANEIKLEGVSFRTYTAMRFNIGLDSLANKTDALPATTDNQNMFWPVPMGGGYHFLKFEGHFLDSVGVDQGYAMHLGTNTCLVTCLFNETYEFSETKKEITLEMNLNKWFESPNTYDLNSAGYIMGNQLKMQEIAANGSDVFTLANQP